MSNRVQPSLSLQRWSSYLLALVVTSAALALRMWLAPWFGDRPVLLLFVLPISLSAFLGGLGPGLLATATAALGTSYFLIPPLHSLAMESSVDTWDWLILNLVGALVSTLTEFRLKRIQRTPAVAGQGAALDAERKVQIGFAFALACLGVVGIISFTSVTRLGEDVQRARRAEQVILTLRTVLSTTTDIETAQRGYAITGTERFLEPYFDALARIGKEIAELRRLTADSTAQQAELERLVQLVNTRIEEATKVVELRRSQGFGAAQAVVASGQGKELQDRVRASEAAMEAIERAKLRERDQLAQHSAMVTRTVISGGSALAIGCVVVALFLIGGDFAGSRRAEAALKEANELLEARVLERTRALGQSEARLGGIVGSAMDAIISVDREQRIVLFNVAAEKLFGCAVAQAIGQELEQFIPHNRREQHRRHVEGFGATGVTSRTMRSLRPLIALRGDGTEFPIEASISQVDVGREKIYTVILRDISERKRAEDAAALLTALVASSSDAIVSKDLQGNVTSWNAGAQKMFGYTPAEIIGQPVTMLIPASMHADEERILARIRCGEGVDHFETVRLRKDGGPIQVSVTVSPIRDASARVVGASSVARDITERKSAEARALWLASFPERNPSPIVELDPTKDIVHYSNPAAVQQFPSLQDEGLRHPLLAGIHALAGALAVQGTVHRELAVGDAYFSQLVTDIADSGRVRIYSTEITARRNAERALREREAELHASDRLLAEIVHGMTEACFALDAEWRFNFVNDRVETLLHQRRERMLGQTLWSVFPSVLGSTFEAMYRRAMVERVPLALEVYSPIAERWLDIRLFPTGEGIAAFLLDIHSRKLAELEREKFVSLVENSSEFIGMRDLAGAPIFINRAALALVGLESLEQAARIAPGEFFFEEDRRFVREEFVPRVLRDGHAETELRFRHFKTGEAIWMIYNAFVVRDLHGEASALATVSRNITERKRAEQEVHRLNADLERRVIERTDQLEQANKELEAFSYSVSHDLRAPLRAVSGFSQIVLEDFGPQLPEEAMEHLQTICNSAQRMGTLIDDLLAFARLSRLPLNKRTVDVEQQVHDALAELQSEQNGRPLELRLGQLPPCHGDPALLKQVWLNLLSNALKYSKNRDPAVIEVGSTSEPGGVAYFVRDNGTGFDMRYANKLFGVFQRLHRQEEFGGTGVGLAIVQRIVNRHGGRIWADALPDQGATFSFTLPGAAT